MVKIQIHEILKSRYPNTNEIAIEEVSKHFSELGVEPKEIVSIKNLDLFVDMVSEFLKHCQKQKIKKLICFSAKLISIFEVQNFYYNKGGNWPPSNGKVFLCPYLNDF